MNRTFFVTKSLVLGICVLFIGVSISPNIAADNLIENDELIEITTEICGFKDLTPQTIQLTLQQLKEVDDLLETVNIQLSQASTKQEFIEILKKSTLELDKYGVFGDLNIKDIQYLTTSLHENPQVASKFEKNQPFFPTEGNERNAFCLVAGYTTNTYSSGIATCSYSNIIQLSIILAYTMFENNIDFFYQLSSILPSSLVLLAVYTAIAGYFIGMLSIPSTLSNLNPVPVFHNIGLGNLYNWPAEGWVNIYGLAGKQQWVGSFYGNIPGFSVLQTPVPMLKNDWRGYYKGIAGFTGIKISLPHIINSDLKSYYFGSALYTNVGEETPDLFGPFDD